AAFSDHLPDQQIQSLISTERNGQAGGAKHEKTEKDDEVQPEHSPCTQVRPALLRDGSSYGVSGRSPGQCQMQSRLSTRSTPVAWYSTGTGHFLTNRYGCPCGRRTYHVPNCPTNARLYRDAIKSMIAGQRLRT